MEKVETAPKVSFENTQVAFGHLSDRELRFSILIFRLMQSPALVKLSTNLTLWALKWRLPISWIVKQTVFKQFCGGETIEDCDAAIIRLGKGNIGAILDYSVEGADEEAVFDATRDELIRVIEKAEHSPNIPVSCMKITGIAPFALLEKVSAGGELTQDERMAYARVVKRFESICKKAQACNVPLYVDAEESWIQPAIDRLAESMMRQFNRERALIFTTLQMYRWDKVEHLEKLLKEAQQEGFVVGVKFVRGAYLEKENQRAQEKGYQTPMQPDKPSSDRDYDKAITVALDHIEHIELCAGTHNEESCRLLTVGMAERGLANNHPHIYFSQLFGMSDHLSFNLANAGYNVSKYLPYGPVKDTIPYLIRRAQENTAIAGQMGKELRLLLQEKRRRAN